MGDNLAEGGAQGEGPQAAQAEALLRWLRRLVTGLAVVMGLGILAVATVLWVRLGPGTTAPAGAIPALPSQIVLPEGVRAQAVTFARDWIVVVADSGEVLLYARDGSLRQRVTHQTP